MDCKFEISANVTSRDLNDTNTEQFKTNKNLSSPCSNKNLNVELKVINLVQM